MYLYPERMIRIINKINEPQKKLIQYPLQRWYYPRTKPVPVFIEDIADYIDPYEKSKKENIYEMILWTLEMQYLYDGILLEKMVRSLETKRLYPIFEDVNEKKYL